MNYRLRYNRRFLREFAEAQAYYDEQQVDGLAERFGQTVERHLKKLTTHPFAYAAASNPRYRRITMRKFPHELFYRIDGRIVRMTRCHHHKRKPLF